MLFWDRRDEEVGIEFAEVTSQGFEVVISSQGEGIVECVFDFVEDGFGALVVFADFEGSDDVGGGGRRGGLLVLTVVLRRRSVESRLFRGGDGQGLGGCVSKVVVVVVVVVVSSSVIVIVIVVVIVADVAGVVIGA